MYATGLGTRHGTPHLTLAATLVALVGLVLAVRSPIVPEQGSGGATNGASLLFVPNAGQTDPSVQFTAGGSGHAFHFTSRKVVLDFQRGKRGVALELRFRGANRHPQIAGERRGTGRVSYVSGSERHPNLATYEQLRYRSLWPGIDMVFRGQGGQLKYEFIVRPGADPADIRLAYAGADGLSLHGGSLMIGTPLGTLRDSPPRSFQRGSAVDSRYVASGSSYGFALGAYDRSRTLVIDPGIVWSTFLGGANNNSGFDVKTDSAGNSYIVGQTYSSDFPTTPGAYDTTRNGPWDVFVMKLSPSGALVYSTYLGGSNTEAPGSVAVDSAGNAYVSGSTTSSDFPTTPGTDRTLDGANDAFVTKLNAAGGDLGYSTYLGGSGGEIGRRALAVDAAGSAYIAGQTDSTDFPLSAGAPDTQTDFGTDGFVTKLDPDGKSLDWSTLVGGSLSEELWDLAVDDAGNAYVSGQTASSDFPTTPGAYDTTGDAAGHLDGFVTKIAATGDGFTYSTRIGGGGSDRVRAIAVDAAGNAYAAGGGSADYPTTPGAWDNGAPGHVDAAVTKFNPEGSALVYSTFLGARGGGTGTVAADVAVDATGAAFVMGSTGRDVPTTPGAIDNTRSGVDAIVMKLNPQGSGLAYSTYLGGSEGDFGQGIALTGPGAAVITGSTSSADFPTTPGALRTTMADPADGFAAKIQTYDGYPRPAGATPLRISLVNGYQQCLGGGNRTHGPPLAYASCNPPARSSAHLTVGTADSNGKVVRYEGYLRLNTIVGNPSTPADEADVGIDFFSKGVLTNALTDYTGELRAKVPLRITDRDAPTPVVATTQDFTFDVDATCAVVPDPSPHSVCQTTTTADALIPGAINEGRRSIWQLGQVVVHDGGSDGDTATAGNTVFARQGVFIP